MSLLEKNMTPFCVVTKTGVPDGYGGDHTQWVDGDPFDAAPVLDTSDETKTAERSDTLDAYQIYTKRETQLLFGQVVKRISDGRLFLITSDSVDFKTPNGAGLNIRVAEARRLEALPNG